MRSFVITDYLNGLVSDICYYAKRLQKDLVESGDENLDREQLPFSGIIHNILERFLETLQTNHAIIDMHSGDFLTKYGTDDQLPEEELRDMSDDERDYWDSNE